MSPGEPLDELHTPAPMPKVGTILVILCFITIVMVAGSWYSVMTQLALLGKDIGETKGRVETMNDMTTSKYNDVKNKADKLEERLENYKNQTSDRFMALPKK